MARASQSTKDAASSKRKKLTIHFVEGLKNPNSGQCFYWDSELPKFGVRVTPGSKTYVVQARVDGKTVRVKLGKHGDLTAEEARALAYKRLGSMASGVNPNQQKAQRRARSVTMREVLDQYVVSKQLRSKTIYVYTGAVRRCFPDWLDRSMVSITKDMVEKRHRELSNANGPRGKGEAQANQAMRVLRSLINFAAEKYADGTGRSIIVENPVRRLSSINAWNRIPRRQSVIQSHELKRWFDAVILLSSDDMRDYLLLCLFTGLRRTEAASLAWRDVHLNDGSRYLRIGSATSKNHEEHWIPLSNFVLKLLQRRRDKNDASPYVFPGDGKDGHIVESKWSVTKVSKASSVKFMMHDLRRTFLTIADRLDIPHYALKRLANHKTSSDVTSGYIINDVERLRDPMQRITDYLLEQCEVKPDEIDERLQLVPEL